MSDSELPVAFVVLPAPAASCSCEKPQVVPLLHLPDEKNGQVLRLKVGSWTCAKLQDAPLVHLSSWKKRHGLRLVS